MQYTLITGASHGLGLEMAHYCASIHQNLILIALPDENLKLIGTEITKKHNVSVHFYECDLTIQKNILDLHQWVETHEYPINFLINNAGFGGTQAFEAMSLEYINTLMDLNIKAVTQMTHCFLPNLQANVPSYLLNVSSMAGNFAFPYKAIYAASKAYVRNFSLGLSEELQPMGISVSVLQPGAIPTNDIVKNQLKRGGFLASFSTTTAKEVAKLAIDATLQRKRIIVPGWKNIVSLFLMQLLPEFIARPMLAKQGLKMLSQN